MIDGAKLIDLTRHLDERGYLYEVIHASDDFLPKFGQVYVVCSPVRGTVRAFHKHEVLWDYFCIVRGTAKLILAKASEEDVQLAATNGGKHTPEALETYILSERKPALLVVPPGIWHGWMALEDETIMVATGSEAYNRDEPDEMRIPPDLFGDVWTVRGK